MSERRLGSPRKTASARSTLCLVPAKARQSKLGGVSHRWEHAFSWCTLRAASFMYVLKKHSGWIFPSVTPLA